MSIQTKNQQNRGNQQGRLIGYLAGIIDGEGTISIASYNSKRKDKSYFRLVPYIAISNTNLDLINKCKEIIDNIGNAYHQTIANDKWGKNKKCYMLRIDGNEGVGLVLKAVINDLSAKKKQANLVLKFLKSREDILLRLKKGHIKRRPFSKEEINIVMELRKIHYSEPSETLRQAFRNAK